jgi:hypothetical protein
MSKRNRNSIFHTWIALCLVFTVVLGWIVWDFSAGLTEQRLRGLQSSNAHIEYAEDRIDERCLALKVVVLRDCIQQEIEAAKDHARANQDLEAQRTMAQFTKIMGMTAIAGVFLGIGSIVLIYLTLSETQRMATETTRIGEAQVRAYMVTTSINAATIFSVNGSVKQIGFKVSLENTGQSPATIHKMNLAMGIVDPKQKHTDNTAEHESHAFMTIGSRPKQPVRLSHWMISNWENPRENP